MIFFDFFNNFKGLKGIDIILRIGFWVFLDVVLIYYENCFNEFVVKYIGIFEEFGKKVFCFWDFDD